MWPPAGKPPATGLFFHPDTKCRTCARLVDFGILIEPA